MDREVARDSGRHRGRARRHEGGEARAQQADDRDIQKRCADACTDCEKMCGHAFDPCFRQVQAGKAGHARAMHLGVDCGEVCSTAGELVARMSPLMVHTCRACAEFCEACIAECEELDDPGIKEFVASLRRCAETCREMVKEVSSRESHLRWTSPEGSRAGSSLSFAAAGAIA